MPALAPSKQLVVTLSIVSVGNCGEISCGGGGGGGGGGGDRRVLVWKIEFGKILAGRLTVGVRQRPI